ncbi:MAG: AMP-binding protein, partial [Ilumatobacteraceae bacterium]
TVAELTPLLSDAAPSVVVVDDEFRATLEQAAAAAGVSPVLVAGERVEEWAASQPDTDPGLVAEPDDIALIFYTSGTTGIPKGAMLPVSGISANLAREVPWDMNTESTVLVCSPVFHTAGTGWTYLPGYCGSHCLMLRDPNPSQILAAISEYHVTQALLVPALIQMVMKLPAMADADVSSLQTLAYGASPISPTLLAAAVQAFGCDLAQAYGMTETGGPITYLGPADHDPADPHGRLSSAGRPPAGIEVQVTDPETGQPRATGETGEVWTRSNQQMIGYLNRPEATAATIMADGWLRTGDAGHMDEDGYLFLTDRLSDVIVSGAENVYPVEVEHVLVTHPAVADAAVIGVPDERWGETVRAVIVVKPGTTIDEAELIAFARERLAHYKAPTGIDVVDDLPRNPAGKVLRRVLREPYWAGRGRSVG